MKLKILSFLFLTISLFSEPLPYYFINVPYGTSIFEISSNREVFIPSFSRIEILEESEEDQKINFLPFDSGKKVKYNGKIGYIPSSYIGTYNIISKKESPDKSKYFEIISPYKICGCNRYGGYIDSCFMEITSAKTNSLIKRIGNEKRAGCEKHFWSRTKNWFNEEELLAPTHGDGDSGSGGLWNFAVEKINWGTGKTTTLYRVDQMNCVNPEANDRYTILYQVTSSSKIYLLYDSKLYSTQTPIIQHSSFKYKYDESIGAYDCKLDFKKFKPIDSESIVIYKEAKNRISFDIYAMFRYYYKEKEILEN